MRGSGLSQKELSGFLFFERRSLTNRVSFAPFVVHLVKHYFKDAAKILLFYDICKYL